MATVTLETQLSEIHSIPPRFLLKLKRLGIETVGELLRHFPTRYEDFSQIYKITDLIPGQEATVQGEVKDISGRRTWRRRLFLVEAIISDDSGSIRAVWFNQPYIRDVLKPGRLANFSGKVAEGENGELYLSNPTYELIKETRIHADGTRIYADDSSGLTRNDARIDADDIGENPHENLRESASIDSHPRSSALNQHQSASIHTGRIVPVYPETRGLTSKGIRYLIKPLLDEVQAEEPIPDAILRREGFPEINAAFHNIHFPDNIADALAAKKRFAFEDLFFLHLHNLRERLRLAKEHAPVIAEDVPHVRSLIAGLPFTLTLSQKAALWEILQNLAKPHPMNRLLQGDVGSGKTVVAALAALEVAHAGYQTAFMAPTEILARQHYQTLIKLFGEFPAKGGSPPNARLPASPEPQRGEPVGQGRAVASGGEGGIALLTGSEARVFYCHGLQTEMKRTELQKAIAGGRVAISIGTHTLIEKTISFPRLAFVVVDEQHRFGVKQRAALLHNANNANSSEYRELPSEEEKIVEKELSYQLQGIFYKIQDKIGRFARERQCADELEQELKNHNLSYQRELPIAVGNRKSNFADFVVENKILVEIKNVPFLSKEDYAQTVRYLNAGNLKLGLLVNFRQKYLKAKRILNSHFASFASDSHSSHRLIPHFLSMSATPIPRTLSLTVFGDLDLSLITELPKDRKPIITKVVAPEHRAKAYQFIREQVRKGRQVFVICPRIESTQINADNELINADTYPRKSESNRYKSVLFLEIKAVKEEYEKLSKKVFPDIRVEMLHGRMKAKEKEAIMRAFLARECDILVSTSVVEVGVDVPNASIMMIESAERFGLAQLYQFRGRVGRGAHQSFCFLFTEATGKTARQRLKSIVEAKNGFELAEKDLKIRGPGEFLGETQSGMPDLAMKAIQNPELVKRARDAAVEILEPNPALKNYPTLRAHLTRFDARVHRE